MYYFQEVRCFKMKKPVNIIYRFLVQIKLAPTYREQSVIPELLLACFL